MCHCQSCEARKHRVLLSHAQSKSRGSINRLSSISCHPLIARRVAFHCSLRTRRLSTVGYVPCATEKISGIAYGRLCLGMKPTHSLCATVVTRLIVSYYTPAGRVCGSMNESRKVISFVGDSNTSLTMERTIDERADYRSIRLLIFIQLCFGWRTPSLPQCH